MVCIAGSLLICVFRLSLPYMDLLPTVTPSCRKEDIWQLPPSSNTWMIKIHRQRSFQPGPLLAPPSCRCAFLQIPFSDRHFSSPHIQRTTSFYLIPTKGFQDRGLLSFLKTEYDYGPRIFILKDFSSTLCMGPKKCLVNE